MNSTTIFKRNLLKLTKRYTIDFNHKERLEKKLNNGTISDVEKEVLIGLDKKINKTLKKIQKLRNKHCIETQELTK